MNHTVKFNVYATPDGVVTHEKEGNRLVLTAGATVSKAQADRLNLAALDRQTNKQAAKVTDPLANLKPATVADNPTPAETDTETAEAETGPAPELEKETGKGTKGRKSTAPEDSASTATQEA